MDNMQLHVSTMLCYASGVEGSIQFADSWESWWRWAAPASVQVLHSEQPAEKLAKMEVTSPLKQRCLYLSTWDCLHLWTVQSTLYKPLWILDYCIRLWGNYCGAALSVYFRAAQLSVHILPTPFQSKCRHNQFQCLCERVQPPSLERKWKHLVAPSKGSFE